MLKNRIFDLISAIQNKSEALAVYDTYAKDSQGCTECQNLWRQLKQREEEDLAKLTAELEKHVKAGELSTSAPRMGMR
ncbi:MAG: hypothetical protein HYY30_01750 [Chloroflexi bacterium]|nr:hypothetical protein [Chloroflexota bacterium]